MKQLDVLLEALELLWDLICTSDSGANIMKGIREGEGLDELTCMCHNLNTALKAAFASALGL